LENPCVIAAFGDSITKGYVGIFRKAIKDEYTEKQVEVLDEGTVGEISSQGLMRAEEVARKNPDVVIIGFGMNDWRKGVSKEDFGGNLRLMIDLFEERGIRVVLMTINPDYQGLFRGTTGAIDEYNAEIVAAAREKRVRTAEVNSLWLRKIRPLWRGLSDAIHPNRRGYEVICEALMRVVPRRNTTVVWQYAGEYCACNYSCPYCYVPSSVNVGDHFTGTIDRWHEAFKKTFGNQHVTFYISFGEPMVQRHFYEVVDMIGSENNWEMMMTTNLSMPLDRLLKSEVARTGRLNVNASFHPTETKIEDFLKQLMTLRSGGIESPVVFVMWPPFIKDFPAYFEEFDKHGFLVHVRRFRGRYEGKFYPEAYTPEERRLVETYMDETSIKYMLPNVDMKGKLSYAGMYYILVTNDGDVALCPDYAREFTRGNVLRGDVKLDLEPRPLPGVKDGTVDGVASLLETGYHELEANHVLSFARQGGVFHSGGGVRYPRLKRDT